MFSICMKFKVERSRSKLRSKPLYIENHHIAIAQSWLGIFFMFSSPTDIGLSSVILANGMKYNSQQNSRWRPGGGSRSLSAF